MYVALHKQVFHELDHDQAVPIFSCSIRNRVVLPELSTKQIQALLEPGPGNSFLLITFHPTVSQRQV